MHIGSETTAPERPRPATNIVANFVGTAIALITLVLPLLVIAHYAPESPPPPSSTRMSN
ncbi:MAG: hypothetical protein KME10_10320 [Plectolyngbya sp. WJT66-NPBG17]|nr:hypothetical protein [Plectolyngbya sp. WJT66-NPBG17]MBW4524867.1 hypothetical protein [Phormidium tanganyikae FI6-MK23]